MKSNILLICILTIFTLSSCDMINNDNKWSHTKFSRIAKSERSRAKKQNHDKNIYGTWQQEKNPDIILKFYDDSRWQYKKGTPNTAGSVFLGGDNFTMQNDILSLYKEDGEIITGKYKFDDKKTGLVISDFEDERYNCTWQKK
ncbi:MAG: hypothetical protein UHW86_01120 [Spirochaetota bacterium]|nr:hypothetical protein [Spirochaetota bacterium]